MELKPTAKPTSLRLLKESVAELKAAQDDVTSKVLNARRCGASWEEIGQLLGITKQRAHQRYSAAARDRSRDDQYTPAENAEADEALAAMQRVAAAQDAAAIRATNRAELARYAADATGQLDGQTSIFLEPAAPATPWTPAKGSPLHSYDTRETSDWYTKYGCGECGRNDRPDTCRNCRVRTQEGTK